MFLLSILLPIIVYGIDFEVFAVYNSDTCVSGTEVQYSYVEYKPSSTCTVDTSCRFKGPGVSVRNWCITTPPAIPDGYLWFSFFDALDCSEFPVQVQAGKQQCFPGNSIGDSSSTMSSKYVCAAGNNVSVYGFSGTTCQNTPTSTDFSFGPTCAPYGGKGLITSGCAPNPNVFTGFYTAQTACNVNSCCCPTGTFEVTQRGNLVTGTFAVTGMCGIMTSSPFTVYLATAHSSIGRSNFGSQTIIVRKFDDTITLTNNVAPQCSSVLKKVSPTTIVVPTTLTTSTSTSSSTTLTSTLGASSTTLTSTLTNTLSPSTTITPSTSIVSTTLSTVTTTPSVGSVFFVSALIFIFALL